MTQNRPIKFRAYLKDRNKIANVYNIQWNEKGGILDTEVYVRGQYVNISYNYLIENIIFMQYTGYEDKNDREIYEGDIVRYYDNICEVKWMFGGFYIRYTDGDFDKLATNKIYLEVIGNIYENPELLETKKEKV